MRKLVFIIVLVSVWLDILYSQEMNQYVIYSFERERKMSSKKKEIEIYYWIVNADFTFTKGMQMFPLYLGGFSNSDFVICAKGDTINPYVVNEETNYDFDKNYDNQINLLSNLINSKKVKVQSVEKCWNNKFKETINVYATPIKGRFAICNLESFDLIDYRGTIFLPLSDFSFHEEFWNTANAKNILYADYSFFFFVNNSKGGSLKNIPFWKK